MEEEKIINQLEPFEDGFNVKTIIAAVFIGLIMLPGAIYLSLVSGGSIAGAAQWVTIILFIEIAKRSFVQLKKQEIYILYLIVPGVVAGIGGGIFGAKMFEQYFVQSTYAKQFGLQEIIPKWVVPPADSAALFRRTFFHHDWFIPIILSFITSILSLVNSIGLGYALFRVTSDVERLPFPLAPIVSEGAMALAESSSKKETWRWRVFSIGSMIGVIFGAFYIVIPTVTGLFMTQPLMLIPIPFVDFTDKIGTFLPGAMLGYMTDLSSFFAGFILPFWVVIGTVIGSLGSRLILNPILCKKGIITNWRNGMTAIPTDMATYMDFWLSITIGVGIVVGIIGIITILTVFMKKRKNETKKIEQLPPGRGDMPLWIAIGAWLITTIAYVIICHILVPDFPILIFCFFGFIMTPFLSYISARMFGITGSLTGVHFPMLIEGSIILSGYKGADIWFAPVPYFNHGGMAESFKQLELTRTKFTSWYKAIIASFLIMSFCSFLFVSLIWRMGPIPSSVYPYAHKMWHLSAWTRALWVSSTLGEGESWVLKAIKPNIIFTGAAGGGLLYLIISVFHLPAQLFYGIVGGISLWPHYALPLFIGALFGRYFFSRRFGEKTWRSYTPVLLAGYGCGMGLVGMAAIALALIAKSVTQLIF